MAGAHAIEGERMSAPGKPAQALTRCKAAMHERRPYVVDVRIERYFEGSASEWYDHFSVSEGDAVSG